MPFTESHLESAIIELFQQQEYDYVHGDNVVRNTTDVILYTDLRTFLQRRYQHDGITANEIETAIGQLTAAAGSSLYEDNAHTLRLLMDGFTIKREDSSRPNLFINPIDYDFPENNIFKVVNQFEVQGDEKRIPDLVVFVNGIPVVVLEFKSAIKEETTIMDAYKQLTVRYQRDIPLLFKYNAFVVISDGVNNKFGSLFADYEFFYAWRKVEQNDRSTDGINSLYTMLQGLFRKERLLEVIHNFIFLPDTPKGQMKIVCRYPQYFAATALYQNILQHSHQNGGDGKGGTYFGATGCGKSFTMLFLARLLMKSRELHSPTILFITDRTDLDDQLSKQVLNARCFIGDDTIKQVESRDQLKKLLQGRTSGGVFLTTIQKFSEDISLLSERANIVCISDEAHRSQTGLGMKLRLTDDGIRRAYGFAKYLHDSLPNATYVGFTGTPIDATVDVFGPVVDAYMMSESVADGITRKIVYEGRASKVILDAEKVKEIEEYYNRCADEGSTEYQIEESKKAMTRLDVILSDPDLLMRIAEDFVEHYERRVEEGSTVKGKAMIVCSTRQIAYYLYQNIIKLRPEWAEVKACCEGEALSEQEKKTVLPIERVKMVVTRDKNDPKELYDLLGSNDYRKQLDEQFKEEKSNFKIAIVVDMWITGFDVPALDTMYCFKPLQRHTLIQTISRVNRVYPGKDKGLVVDYLGIKNNLNLALKQYGGQGDLPLTSLETIEQSVKLTKDELDILRRMFHTFDFSAYYTGKPLEQLDCLNRAAEFVQQTKDTETQFMGHTRKMRCAYNICCNSDQLSTREIDDIHFFMAVRSIIFKLTRGTAADTASMNKHVADLIRDALISEQVEEITKIGAKEDELDLFSEQYMERLNRLKLPNTKVKLMERLLRQVIDHLQKVNKAKGIDFSQRLEAIVKNYNDRSDNTTLANEVIDEVVSQMTELLVEINHDKQQSEEMGISYEEKSFYDILMLVAKKYNFEYPEDKAIALAKEIKIIVDDKAKYTDWSRREDIKAELKMNLILVLSEYGYPPFVNDEVFKEILEQAENFKKNEPNP
ncbi:MAG: type I restriction endonuclease subunit R [Bacteroidales bacterium]|nr:type I restriction endonuclease subunit R [Bacteroidales bacterium]